MPYYTYLIASRPHGALYVGVTSDLVRRTFEHRTGTGSSHTSKYHIRRLVWFEVYDNIEFAIRREKRLKKYPRQWKINLIEAENPMWRDLFDDICR